MFGVQQITSFFFVRRSNERLFLDKKLEICCISPEGVIRVCVCVGEREIF